MKKKRVYTINHLQWNQITVTAWVAEGPNCEYRIDDHNDSFQVSRLDNRCVVPLGTAQRLSRAKSLARRDYKAIITPFLTAFNCSGKLTRSQYQAQEPDHA